MSIYSKQNIRSLLFADPHEANISKQVCEAI